MIPIFIQFRLPRIVVKIFRKFSALCTENDRKWLFVGKNKLAASISIHFSVKIVFSLIISGLESIINFFSDVNLQNIRSSIRGMLKWKWWNISLAELTCPYAHWAIWLWTSTGTKHLQFSKVSLLKIFKSFCKSLLPSKLTLSEHFPKNSKVTL